MTPKDVPPNAPGIPWDIWYEQQIDRIFAEAHEKRKTQPAVAIPSIKTTGYSAAIPSSEEDRLFEISPYIE